MDIIPTFARDGGRISLSNRVRRWPFWALNGPAKVFLVTSEFLTVLLTGLAVVQTAVTATEMNRFVLLIALAIGYGEAADRVERLKRYLGSDRVWSNHISVWAFAAALLLPTGYAGLLIAAVYLHVLILGRRHHSVRPHRLLFTASTSTLATFAAAFLLHHVDAAVPLGASLTASLVTVAAMVIFQFVNLAVLLAGIAVVTRPPRLRSLLPARDAVGFECLTLVLGVVTAEFVLRTVWLTPVVLVLVAAMNRSSLVNELQVAATTDLKTGLLNAPTWQLRAAQALSYASRGQTAVAVILIDLDHFKLVNDTHGHMTGDKVLVEVADALCGEIADHDAIGRFGGEEFVVLVQGTTLEGALAVAERLRAGIADIAFGDGGSVTASIGLAHATQPGAVSLDELMESADGALYAAKDAGRNRVQSTVMPSAKLGV